MDFRTIANHASSGADAGATGNPRVGASIEEIEALFAQLMKEAAETPESAREAVLKKHDLNEADYRGLPQAEREGIDREIAQAVRRVGEQRRASMAARNGAAV